MSKRYGIPPEVAVRDQSGLAVVAYGKIGGIALGYGVLARLQPRQRQRRARAIDSRPFYLRL